jgi:hypothetical protein
MEGAEVYNGTQRLPGFDLYVFQKAYLSKESRRLIKGLAAARAGGAPIMLAFDLCDPDHLLSATHRERLLDVLPLFDFATAPTAPLVKWLRRYLPAFEIPDRVWFAEPEFPERRAPNPTRKPRCVWAGYEGNAGPLETMLPDIKALGLPVDTVLIERPVPFRTFWQMVTTRDILLNPRPEVGLYSYKSDNKTFIAWWLGIPVARTVEELAGLIDPEARRREVNRRRVYVKRFANVHLSAWQWGRAYNREKLEGGIK